MHELYIYHGCKAPAAARIQLHAGRLVMLRNFAQRLIHERYQNHYVVAINCEELNEQVYDFIENRQRYNLTVWLYNRRQYPERITRLQPQYETPTVAADQMPLSAAEKQALVVLGADSLQPEALKKAYRLRAAQVHPDKPGGSVEQFKALQSAYLTLGGGIL